MECRVRSAIADKKSGVDMTTNVDRFRKDLDRLIERSKDIQASAMRHADPEDFKEQLLVAMGGDLDKVAKFDKNLPRFAVAYEAWYSEALPVIAQLLPTRLADFKSYYEVPKSRRELNNMTYTIHDMIQGLSIERAGVLVSAGLTRVTGQINILKAAEQRFESSLFEIRQLVQADLFDTEIDAARELLKNRFTRAAGAVAGVVLEGHLKQVCDDRSIKLAKAKPTLAVLNDALKDAGTIDVPQWRFNQHLADIRNSCDHARNPEPTVDQVRDLIDGTAKVLKTIA